MTNIKIHNSYSEKISLSYIVISSLIIAIEDMHCFHHIPQYGSFSTLGIFMALFFIDMAFFDHFTFTFTIKYANQITVKEDAKSATFKNLEIISFPFLLATWRLFYAYINCPSYPLILLQSGTN